MIPELSRRYPNEACGDSEQLLKPEDKSRVKPTIEKIFERGETGSNTVSAYLHLLPFC